MTAASFHADSSKILAHPSLYATILRPRHVPQKNAVHRARRSLPRIRIRQRARLGQQRPSLNQAAHFRLCQENLCC